jgi:hypothetical protein
MDDPVDFLTFDSNKLLNLKNLDLESLISKINESDAPGFRTISESTTLVANYEPSDYDIYIPNNFKVNEMNSFNVNKFRKILPVHSPQNNNNENMSEKNMKTDFVKYGRGCIKKNSDEYHDMRRRNNEAIHKCRQIKSGGVRENKMRQIKELLKIQDHYIIK